MFKFFKSKPEPKPLEITESNFNDLVFNYDKPVLLDFKASWCQPCQVMISLVNRLLREENLNDDIRIGVVDINNNPALVKHFGVRSVPTLLFLHEKKVKDRFTGLMPYPKLKESIEDFIRSTSEEEE